jgi:uncharacterized protein YgbK (DUF1537 family)
MFQNETPKERHMVDLLIIADDLTGALDTGIQFARYNKTKVFTKSEFSNTLFYESDTEVLVVDTESRHLTPKEAYEIVYSLSKMAAEAGVKYIYKKTDSALRGNIGSELAALLEASKEKFLAFIPALPLMNRVTIQGIQYIDGIPVHESVFGSDPYDPVKSPYVSDLFEEVTCNTVLYKRGDAYFTDLEEPTIGIFDAQTNDDLRSIGRYLNQNNQLKAIAGCTGFAAILPEIIGVRKTDLVLPVLNKPLLVMCGSLNPISRQQIEYCEEMGFNRIVLSPEQLLEEDYFSSHAGEEMLNSINAKLIKEQVVVIDSGISQLNTMDDYMSRNGIDMDGARIKITRALGTLLEKFYKMGIGYEATVMIIGGDTLKGFIEQVDCDEINMLCEITMGTVLSSINIYGKYAQIISKSGGFGAKELIYDIANMSKA